MDQENRRMSHLIVISTVQKIIKNVFVITLQENLKETFRILDHHTTETDEYRYFWSTFFFFFIIVTLIIVVIII